MGDGDEWALVGLHRVCEHTVAERGRDGARRATVAAPRIGYRRVLSVDAERAYFSAATDPNRSELWAAPLDGDGQPRAVSHSDDGSLTASFGDSERIYAYVLTASHGAPEFGVGDVSGKTIGTILTETQAPPFVPKLELSQIDDGANVAIIRPRNFDPTRRYPVIDNVYGSQHGARRCL